MDFEKLKITDEEIETNGLCSAADSLNGTARENKERFDKLPKLIIERHNSFIDECVKAKSEIDNAGYITDTDIPKKLSDFENDKGYITESAIPEKLSELENDKGFITASEIPGKLSEFENDSGYITESSLPKKLSEIENDTGYITESAIPEKLSDFENDKGFITDEALPKKVSQLENDAGFVTGKDLSCDTKYDTVITSQEEWDAMIESSDWNGARNILFKCHIKANSKAPDTERIYIPSSVVSIDGNGYSLGLPFTYIEAVGANTSLRNCKPLAFVSTVLSKINGIYDCVIDTYNGTIEECKNIIGCDFICSSQTSTYGIIIRGCDTVFLNTSSKEKFENRYNWVLENCTNIIYEKTKLSEFDNDEGFITDKEIPTKVSQFENDAEYVSSNITIPKYWENAVNEVERKITELQNIGGADSFTFGFITDTHTISTHKGGFVPLMEHVLKECDIPVFMHGGDFISGVGVSSKEEHLSEIQNHNRIFRSIEDKCLLAIGNHDHVYGSESNYDSSLSNEEFYNRVLRKNEHKTDLVFGDGNTYFYKDIPAQKTRYIVLNCYDWETRIDDNGKILEGTKMGFSRVGSKQLKWLATTALKVPDNYSIVICSHAMPLYITELPDKWNSHMIMQDAEVVRGIINAYRNKSTYTHEARFGDGAYEDVYLMDFDFTDYAGEIVCWMCGHTHCDKIFNVDGLTVVSTANCSSHVQSYDAPIKASGTDTEYIMDFVCVNKRARSCNIIRLGAALDVDGSCMITTYTNLINKNDENYKNGYKLNISGEPIYNNLADKNSEDFKIGYRINSLGVEVADSKYAISNYITISSKQVIHVKGWRKTDKYFVVTLYASDKSVLKIYQYTVTNTAKNFITPDYDDSVMCFNLGLITNTDIINQVCYVRISGEFDENEEQIITVDEDILGLSSSVIEAEGYSVSNFIPLVYGDVLHIKGFDKNGLAIDFYKVDKREIELVQWTDVDASKSWIAPDYDSGVICYDTNLHDGRDISSVGVRYARISGKFDENVEQIITVNENIEATVQEGRGFNY